MISIILTSIIAKLVVAVAAYIVIRLVLRQLDRSAQIYFSDWYHDADPKSRAIYFGCRIIAICLLFGLILSG